MLSVYTSLTTKAPKLQQRIDERTVNVLEFKASKKKLLFLTSRYHYSIFHHYAIIKLKNEVTEPVDSLGNAGSR